MKEWYPGKAIIVLSDTHPTEIICEVEPTAMHSQYGVAISVIDSSAPHHHMLAKEMYTILEGELDLFIDDRKHHLIKGDSISIPPQSVHYAIGNETWVECKSEPGWTVEDHILEEKK